ncbi:Panacea domain-containing protein [bacterium endosymbiont of Bathymodiolus sp. 5 South]|jgi:uncharacterized phage-associated protein|uniref:Panacea domain-containing protein n=1 Tax=bacterium endosymbiont of Bathymodiolus sp. 5 South TaxID=1181670 RepID=UPI0010B206BA|nr:type II toxin-antitoxin system antitoxin SocA domain-containing protein [bacterium endosymbiont of Bathymodiolus sp. 5 South]CAC9644138.1 hypothetical protein [uncultured Gammaproteobacteria bacterium]CAC9645116.1 hypothetical protein [uncultured Gammaproteobacteria bacterium]SHN93671.1 hypothetical protein BCLUESOX_841 [bacterium endosymbiont of Bathymodiolus sp. 5 South]VVH54896.1 hypothetical protein BSPCLSOX_1974 [uncultured Gammaproteobacteria bacterium]VVH61887.1 hypothetical protein 
MVYSVITIANKFIDLAKNENLTNMQLQKMVYIAHGFNLALRGTKLYYEDTRAWNFGPVVPELYEKLQIYGSNKVTDKISISNVGEEELDDYSSEIINAVYDNYKKYNGIQLSNLTHQANTPWSKSWKNNKYGVIPADDICEFYKNNYT